DPTCPACGTREIRELADYDAFCGIGPAAEDVAVPEITPSELAARLSRRDDVALIDVREPYEGEIARLPGARLVPLAALAGSMADLDDTRDLVVHCKSGGRSAQAVRQLRAAGLRRVWNLTGGINRWSDDVDPATPKY